MAFDFPNTPTTNQIVTMPDGTVRKWDGVKWVAGQTPVAPYCYTGDTPPSNPTPGASWWDSVSCQLFVYYNDGNSSQWVPAVAIPASVGEAPSNSNYYARRNGQWADIGTSQLAGNVGRNLIHNSMFNVNQRGLGPWVGGYTADRWFAFASSDTISYSFMTASDGDRTGIGDEAVRYYMRNTFTGNAAAGAYNIFSHKIEDVRRLAGKTVTVSFWAAGASLKLGVNVAQNFGSGGSPSASVSTNGQSVTLTAGWTRYSLTFTLPAATGKTFGTAGDDNTQLNFWYSSGTTNAVGAGNIGVQSGTIYLWGIQLEIGSVATQLEKIPLEDDLRHCQRFYYSTTLNAVASGYHPTAASLGIFATIPFPITMRAVPTANATGSVINANAITVNQITTSGYTFTATNTNPGSFQIQTTGTSTFSADL